MIATTKNQSFLLTPPGTGAIGVIRVSGPDACAVTSRAFKPRTGGPLSPDDEGRLRYGKLTDGGETLDDVIVSVTNQRGLWEVDITAHGGVRIIERILHALDKLGAPLAHGKPRARDCWPADNLIETEALEALNQARTKRAVQFLAWQRQHLPTAIEMMAKQARSDPDGTAAELATAIGGYERARVLLDGATVGLIGPPNGGKSTLFNRLIGRSAAIVSPRAGTTRDWISQPIEIEGIPITLVDTAGQTAATDELEKEAISAARRIAGQADICLVLFDGSQMVKPHELAPWSDLKSYEQRLTVVTKLDLGTVWDEMSLPVGPNGLRTPFVRVSAHTGSGIEKLIGEVLALLGMAGRVDNIPCLFSIRQVDAAERALTAMQSGAAAADIDLRSALIGG